MDRLAKGELLGAAKSRFNYGKLMERMLYFRSQNIPVLFPALLFLHVLFSRVCWLFWRY